MRDPMSEQPDNPVIPVHGTTVPSGVTRIPNGKKHPTLADAMLIELNRYRSNDMIDAKGLQRDIISARKFVLDDEMSAFCADLAYAPLVLNNMTNHLARNCAAVDYMRRGARLPHSLMWIEFNMSVRVKRARDEYGVDTVQREWGPQRIGWLLHQHPQIETAFMCCTFASHSMSKGWENNPDSVPVSTPSPYIITYQWRADDDGTLPWSHPAGIPKMTNIAECLSGLIGYQTPFLGLCKLPYAAFDYAALKFDWSAHLNELASDARYLWSLLAAINDVPTGYEAVRPQRGYIAKGVYKKYLEHSIIRLKVPHKIPLRLLAKRAIAIARRRAHMVRGHWRRNYRKPGERIWIKEHQRGSAELGFVTHDYSVEHEKE
jgi:hypothetical protein